MLATLKENHFFFHFKSAMKLMSHDVSRLK